MAFGYQAPSIRNLGSDYGGNESVEFITPLPSAVNGTPLRPNRLGPNGDIELGAVQDRLRTGEWVNNWTLQFASPLGEFLASFHLPPGRADVPHPDVMQRRT